MKTAMPQGSTDTEGLRSATAVLRSGAGVRVAGRVALPRLRWSGIRPHRWGWGEAAGFLARLRGQLVIQC
jgi:hypothetical protein